MTTEPLAPVGTPAQRPVAVCLNGRAVGVSLLILLGVTAAANHASENNAAAAAAKVLLSIATLGLAPGALAALLIRGQGSWKGSTLFALGMMLSLALAQVLTVLGLSAHLPTMGVALGYLIVLGAVALLLVWRNPSFGDLELGRTEAVLFLVIAVLGIAAYLKGSPLRSDEEQVHASIIRRLSNDPAPGIDNIYPARGVVYTHPYPGTHYFMAMTSSVGGIDPMFVYHKARCYWTTGTLLFLYLLAAVAFGTEEFALASLFAGAALALNGCFADFDTLFWGQLVPFSHPSDIAMSVSLPGLLFLAYRYFVAEERCEARLFLISTLVVTAMITMVHIREAVQFLIYLGCLFLVLLVVKNDHVRVRRVLLVMGVATLIVATYGKLHSHFITHVSEYDQAAKANILASLKTGTFKTLVMHYSSCASDLKIGGASIFYGWNFIILAVAPFVCLLFRQRPIVVSMGLTMFLFLLLIRIPVLALVYTYCTYYEILVTPARNYSFFLYLFAGPCLLLLARAILFTTSAFRWLSIAGALALVGGLGWATRLGWAWWRIHPDRGVNAALLLFLLAAGTWLVLRKRTPVLSHAWITPKPAHLIFAALLVCATLTSGMWKRSPFSLHYVTTYSPFFGERTATAATPAQLYASFPSVITPQWELERSSVLFAPYGYTVRDNVSTPPPQKLIEWTRRELSPRAVLCVNGFNAYPACLFLPQQITAWPPIVSFNLFYPKALAPAYYAAFDAAMEKYQCQPFFNGWETNEERLEFLRETGATHVLIDPAYYRLLKPTLDESRDHFKLLFDSGDWAVYAVE